MSHYFKVFRFWQRRLSKCMTNFYPWKLAPTWKEFGNNLENQSPMRFSKIDCTLRRYVSNFLEVIGCCSITLIFVEDEVPKISMCKNGKKVTDYRDKRTFDYLHTFVKQSLNLGNIREDTMSKSESSTNFIKIIQNGVTIVKFYSPTCPHCQNFAPVWDQLISTYGAKSKVKFSDIDCTHGDLCEQQGIVGVPTLHVYKNGVKIDEYTEGWSFGEVHSFVKQYLDLD